MISWRTGEVIRSRKKSKRFLNDFSDKEMDITNFGVTYSPPQKTKGFHILATFTVHELKTVDNIFLHRKKNEDDF